MKPKSIRYYFFTSITTVLVASTLVMGLIQSYLATTYFREEREALLDQVVTVIEGGVRTGQLDIDSSSMESIGYMAQVAGAVVFVTGPVGGVRYSVGEMAPAVGSFIKPEVLETVADVPMYHEVGNLSDTFENSHYISAVTMRTPEGALVGYAFAGSDASGMQIYLLDTMSTFILSAAVVLLISSILALALANRTVLPLRNISAAAKRFAEGDYSVRVPVQGDDELAALSVTFNEMANSFESTDISRRSFMGNIAHELRTPMTTIKGFIDGMLDGTIPVDQRDRYLAVVSDEVGRLARLTKNMLDVSRLEAGEYTPNNTVFDIWGPLATVMLGAEQRLEDKRLDVEGLDHDMPAWVMADEDFVHQILYNLTDNAIKFANEGGIITLSVKEEKNNVIIGVKNTGQGIEPGALDHVFDRFYKADKSRGVNARGAGLGLHISKVLVGLMGGRMWVESEEGQWTEFFFTLPAAPAKRGGQPRRKKGETRRFPVQGPPPGKPPQGRPEDERPFTKRGPQAPHNGKKASQQAPDGVGAGPKGSEGAGPPPPGDPKCKA